MGKVCVLGAGIIGLTTATLLQEKLPDLEITVISEGFNEDTTSDVAAGLFRPGGSFGGPDPQTTLRWAKESFAFYSKLLSSPNAEEIGLRALDAVAVSSTEEFIVENKLLESTVFSYRKLTPEELKRRPGGDWKHGIFYQTLLTECRRYLPYLAKKFQSRGGIVRQRKISSFEELQGEYDVVVNCTGIGAKFLCGDSSLIPVRGQAFKVKAPWIKQCIYADTDCYIIPGIEFVTLGGVRQLSSWNKEVDRHDSNGIWERCLKAEPSLRNAQIVAERVGFRPYRPQVRVESEELNTKKGPLKLVHHYGHGGYGIMFAPGTSMDAVKLVCKMLSSKQASAKL